MESLRITLHPLSAFGGPIKGDSLFGQLCWAARNRWGEERLGRLLDGYTNGRPFAVCSDAFPAGHLPRPTLPLHRFDALPDMDRKAIKRRRWLPHDALKKPVGMWLTHCRTEKEVLVALGADAKSPGVLTGTHAQPHNSIDRLTGTTGGADFAPYTLSQHWFGEAVRLDCYLLIDTTRLTVDETAQLLRDIGLSGYGRDANIGLGKFAIEEILLGTLAHQPDADACFTLAPCAPQGASFDPTESHYEVFTRFGRHGDSAVHSGLPFKAPALLAQTGAVLASKVMPDHPFVGQGLGGDGSLSNAIPETVQQGYAPCIGIRIGGGHRMTQSQYWSLAITPLSSVHLGTGQDYEPTGYVIDNGALYEFDGVAALQALPAAERARLGSILDRRSGPDMLREVQSFFHKNRERLIAVSRHQVRVNSSIEAFYGERVGQVVQHEHGGKKVQNKLEIERTAYTSATGAAILPGSGLKGAIRTALLDAVNDGRPLPASLERDRQANRKLQEQLFKGKFHTDPLRLIRLGDAGLSNPEDFSTEVRFALNRKKQPVRKDGVLIQSQAEQHGLYQLLECLPAFQTRAFEGSLSIQGTGGVESSHWPEPDMRFRLPQIAVACNRFYRPKLDDELELLRNRGYLDTDWGQRLQSLLAGPVGQSLDANRAFLLRVGRHSGAESVTLDGLGNHIKIMKGRGERPDYLDHAKTLWLAGDERQIQTKLQPFGWLLVEPFEEASQLPPWQEDVENADITTWRIDIKKIQAEKAAKLEQERQREAERKQAGEKAEREAAARKALLESRSEEGRKIEGLRELLAKYKAANRKQAGGELASSLVALLKEAEENWQGQECADLADLALEIYGFIGWPASKKKRQRKAQVEAIRQKAE